MDVLISPGATRTAFASTEARSLAARLRDVLERAHDDAGPRRPLLQAELRGLIDELGRLKPNDGIREDAQSHPPGSRADNLLKPRRASTMTDETAAGPKPVIVRTYSAGVHFGYLTAKDGQEVTLERSRRIWRWFGAWTLSEIATKGLDTKKSKVAAPVTITLPQAIEIIECTPEAAENIESAQWAA